MMNASGVQPAVAASMMGKYSQEWTAMKLLLFA
jgi:hypothetical protein